MHPSQAKREKHREQVGYDFSVSAAGTVCKVLGLIETKNTNLLKLRQDEDKYAKLKAIMLKKASDRTKDESNDIKKEAKKMIDDILKVADLVFSTTTTGATFGKEFRDRCHLVAIDEAVPSTELEILAVWKGGKQKLILAGDVLQPSFPTMLVTQSQVAYTTPSRTRARRPHYID